MKRLFCIALLILGLFSSVFAQQTVEFTPVTEYNSAFQAVYARHPKIPRGVLEAVAYQNTHMKHLSPEEIKPACNGMPPVYGIMGLMPNGKNWFRNNLMTVSQLSGMSPGIILSSPENCIEAYARAFDAKLNTLRVKLIKPADYIDVILSLSELPDRNIYDGFCLDTYAYGILTFLQTPEYQSAYNFPNYYSYFDLKSYFGETNYKVLSATFIEFSEHQIKPKGAGLKYNPYAHRKNVFKNDTPEPNVSDYSGAIWDPTTCNFSSRNGTAITHVTIHTMQGSYAGSISWFKNCTAQVSAHYCVRASDGQVTQMVQESDKAWHVGNSNSYAIGIENEGFVDDPTWYTTAMYQANTAICQDIASRRGFDLKRAFDGPSSNGLNPISDCWIIKGHQHFASQTHTDPGLHWDWKRFYEMLNNTMPVTAYTSASGTFLDPGGNGNYGDRERKRYRISPTGARTVTLNFTAFNVENNYDYLRIYDGQDFRAPLIGSFTGTNLPSVITGTTGHLFFEFESDCATNASGWSANWSSSSLPPACTTPSGLAQISVGHSAANLSWGAVSGAVNYEVRYRRSFINTWTVATSNTNSFTLTGLASNGHYYWQVRTNCGNNLYSSYAGASFVTFNRSNATINSCTGTFTDAGGSEGKYANNESWVTTIAPTGASSITMNFTSFATANSSDYLKIYNGANVNAPLIGTYHTNTSPGTVTGTTGSLTLQFVSNASTVANGWVASWTCQNGGGCGTPTGPATSAIRQNTATFSWASVMNATSYEVRYRRTVDVTWTSTNTTQISYIATGLIANTAYEWQVRAVCSGVASVWTASSNFMTLPTCNTSSGLNASGITVNGATLGWNAVVGAVNYTLGYKPNSGGTWTEVTVSGTSYIVTGLSANTLYDYRVQTNCSGSQSAFTPVSNFTTLPLPCNVPSGLNTTVITNNSAILNWASVANAVDYTVRYRNTGNPNWTTQTTVGLFYNLTGLLSSTIYEWQVQANCSGNNSGFTLSANFTTTAPPACPVPTGTVTSNITHNSAVLSWDAMSGAVNYRVIYRLSSDVNWTGFDVNGTTTTLTGLLPNEEYRWGVRSNCDVSNSAYSSALIFNTLIVCNTPSGLATSSITTNSATLSWGAVSGAVNYTAQWRVVGAPSWSTTTVSGTSHILTGLSANTAYEWQVRTNCSGNNSAFSSSTNFTTLIVCNTPSGLATSSITTNSATLSWGAVSGAVNYTAQWRVVGAPSWSTTTLAGTSHILTGLSANTAYEWQVRTNCSGNNSAFSGSNNFNTLVVCDVPIGLATSGISTNSATLSWGTVVNALTYTVQWRVVGAPSWSTTTVSGTTHILAGLTANTAYEWQVRTNCSGNNSAFSSSANFTTLILCATPTGMTTISITPTGAALSWGTVVNALTYTVQWRVVGAPSWSTTTLPGTSHILTGLTANTAYEWQVRTNCTGNNSAFSSSTNFTTLIVCNTPSGLNSTGVSSTVATVNWSPVTGAVDYTLQYKATASPTWTSIVTTATSYNLSALTASTAYDWRVRTNCGNNNLSAYSTVLNFTTTASCTDLNESNNSSTTATPLIIGTSKLGRICGAGDVDWFKFTIGTTTNVRVTLSQLPQNYNLELFINGTFVSGSYQTGVANDVIIRNGQTANTLYYRVYGQSNVYDNLLDYRILAETSNVAYRDDNAIILDETELVRIYPNPATDAVNLTFQHSVTGNTTVQITDMTDKTVYQSIIVDPINGFTIPTQDWSNGIYIVKVMNENRVQTGKLIIQR